MKSNFSQTRPSRPGFDFEREAFRAELILNEIKQVGFIWLIGCVIMNALLDKYWTDIDHTYTNDTFEMDSSHFSIKSSKVKVTVE